MKIRSFWTQQFIFFFLCCGSIESTKYHAVVYPEVFDARDDDETRVLKVNEDITLNLKPGSILHPEFFLRTYRQGVPQHTYFSVDALEQYLYHDEKHFAAVILNEENDAVQVKGVVGPNLKIIPAVGMERSEDGRHPHILETIHDTDADHVYAELPEERKMEVSARYLQLDPKAYNIRAVYPEVFLVVDSELYRGFKSYKDMIYYFMVEYTCVTLRYTTVDNPRIKPILRGIEVTDYKREGRYYKYIGSGIDALKSLYQIVEFVKENKNLYEEYDMVYFATGRDMIAVQGSRQESVLQGFAFVASACTTHRQQLGEDRADSFIGIRITAHEIGHTLGCSHDGTNVDGIIKDFKSDSLGCPWQDGFIMSYIEEDRRSYRFSTCCNYMMSLVSWSVEAACLRSNQTVTTYIRTNRTIYLPGQRFDRDKQCKMTFPTLPDTYYMKEFGAYQCKAECFVNGLYFQASNSHWSMLLIDGTVCDEKTNRVCINGDCVTYPLPPYPRRKRNITQGHGPE